jgi:uncharacterized NAD-dependent epimerase/dehydratase family protein
MALNHAPFPLKGRKALLLAEGNLSMLGSKTATCYLRYRGEDVVAVLDSAQGGRRVQDVLGFGGGVPVVSTVEEALSRGPELAIVGVAPRGGRLGGPLREQVLDCVRAGMDVASGLHTFLRDDPEFVGAAKASGSKLWDLRYVPATGVVSEGKGCTTGAKVVLLTGTDCNVGKMTAAVEIYDEAVRRGINAAWAATGQTGILLRERGVCIDRVIGDFMGGAAEELVNFEGRGKDLVIVEGQGSLGHPGFAGVTLALMFGAAPDCMVLAHEPGRTTVRNTDIPMMSLKEHVAIHERLMAPLRKSRVVAVALNTAVFEKAAAEEAIARVRRETGLPASDPVRFGASGVLDAVMEELF